MFFFAFFVGIAKSSLVNYKFWNDIGQIFQDWSGNGLHAVNGMTLDIERSDGICTDRGVYLDMASWVSVPPNAILNETVDLYPSAFISLYILPIENGRLLYKKFSDLFFLERITIFLDSKYSFFSENKGAILTVPVPYKTWTLLQIEISSDSISTFIQGSLLYTSSFSISNSLLLFASTFFLGLGFQGFLYEMWVDSVFSSYILKVNSESCISGQCFFGFSSDCNCDYCIISPSPNCISTVLSPYESSNQKSCLLPSTPADTNADCRVCPSNCGLSQCTSNYECHSFCISPCSECLEFTYCLQCTSPLMVLSQGICTCPVGFYLDYSECHPCYYLCSHCTGIQKCTQCKDPNSHLFHTDYGYQCTCKFSTYWNGLKCENCAEECLGCKKKAKDCIMCRDLNSEKVLDQGCACKKGFFLHENSCEICGESCEQCSALEKCEVCENGFYVNDGICKIISGEVGGILCPHDFFFFNGTCKKCEKPCVQCVYNETNCVTCRENAMIVRSSISNFTCECAESFSFFNQTCVVALGLSFNTLTPNCIHLEFTEELVDFLNFSSFEVYSNYSISYELIKNLTIFITCDKTIENLHVALKFQMLKGVLGGILLQTDYSLLVNCTPDTVFSDNSVSTFTSYLLTGITVFCAFLGINNSGSSLVWTLIGTMQLLSYLSLININYPPLLQQYFLALNYLLIPNFFEKFMKDLDPNSFLGTTGRDISIFIISIVLYMAVAICVKVAPNGKFKKVFRKLSGMMRWNLFIRVWILCFIEIAYGSVLQLRNLSFSTMESLTNTILSIFFFIFICLTPTISYLFLTINYYQTTKKDFLKKYTSLVGDFNPNHLQSILFYYYFFLRRLIYMVSLLTLSNFPIVQLGISISLSLFFLIYLVKSACFKQPKENRYNIICEISILLSSIICCGFIADLSKSTSNSLVYLLLSIGATVTLINFLMAVQDFWKKFRTSKPNKIQHGNTIAVHKNLPSLGALHMTTENNRNNSLDSENS